MRRIGKYIYRCLTHWVRHYGGKKEKALAERDKEYIRAKRNKKHLPDSWTDTRWIKRCKSWKARSKANHQYEKREYSNFELNEFYNNAKKKEEFLYKLYILKKTDPNAWRYIDSSEVGYFYRWNDVHNIALDLYEEGLIIAEVFIYIDNGKKKKEIIRCKLP